MPDGQPAAGGLTIDAMHEGNVARFINHSCAPNLDKQMVLTARAGSSFYHYVGLFATQEGGIAPYEELTYDYKWQRGGRDVPTQCVCGAPECVGQLL